LISYAKIAITDHVVLADELWLQRTRAFERYIDVQCPFVHFNRLCLYAIAVITLSPSL